MRGWIKGGEGSKKKFLAQNHTPPLFFTRGNFSKVIQPPQMVLFCKIRNYKSNMYSGFINGGTLNFCVQIWPPENNQLSLHQQISERR